MTTRLPARAHTLLILLGLMALVLFFFQRMAFTNLILARGDTFLYFYPYWEAASQALRAGRVPLWNPDLFMGAPFLANSQVGFFYPLNWLVWIWLPVPYAVSASIVVHVWIAGIGAYLAGRRALRLDAVASLITAVSFALGGYLTAQVEHVNQLQGLAWLPWFLVAVAGFDHAAPVPHWRKVSRTALQIGLLFALQLTAGHTQTTFITGVTMVLWVLGQAGVAIWVQKSLVAEAIRRPEAGRWLTGVIFSAVLGGVFALGLTAVQLLPTLELAGLSSRQGGLSVNEVLSFSWHPLLLARSLLPGYGLSLFSEYTAVLPVGVYLLAIIGTWHWRHMRGVLPAMVLVVMGVFLALGVFNPFNWVLAQLPGFNLFRVPARWLAMVSLGLSLLAGVGWQVVWKRSSRLGKRPLLAAGVVLGGLAIWGVVAPRLAGLLPVGPEAPVELLPLRTVVLWLAEFVAVAGICLLMPRFDGWRRLAAQAGLGILLVGSLFAATRTHPYHNLTTPEAYFDLRPSTTRLLAENKDVMPGDRLLSLSGIFFDPGDQAEIDAIYHDQLPLPARYDYTIAVKQKEIISPNLPLVYGLPTVDGFDGGILPLASYSQLMRLVLPAGQTTTDGRLREMLTAVPDSRWLNLFNIRFVLTDKTGDEWRQVSPELAVFFDRQLPRLLAAGERVEVETSEFEATAVYVLAPAAGGSLLLGDGRETTFAPVGDGLWRADVPPASGGAAALVAGTRPWEIEAVTAVHEAERTFYPLTPAPFRLIHSGDVKIYENRGVLPRAFWVTGWEWVADVETAVSRMQSATFDPRETAVILGDGQSQPAITPAQPAAIIHYSPEQVEISVVADSDALLVLSDFYYPGWEVAIDGEAAPLQRVNGTLRGVFFPAGTHEIVFTYRSRAYESGRLLSLLSIVIAIVGLIGLWQPAQKQNASMHPTANRHR